MAKAGAGPQDTVMEDAKNAERGPIHKPGARPGKGEHCNSICFFLTILPRLCLVAVQLRQSPLIVRSKLFDLASSLRA